MRGACPSLFSWSATRLFARGREDWLLGGSGGVVNSLDFYPTSLKSLGCFCFPCVLSSQWKAVTVTWEVHSANFRGIFERCYRMKAGGGEGGGGGGGGGGEQRQQQPMNRIFSTHDLLVNQKIMQRHLFHPPSPFPLQWQQYWHLYCIAVLVADDDVELHVLGCRLTD